MQPFVLLWLISSAVDSAKSQTGARQDYFTSIYQPRPRRWPGFLVSFLMHALVLLWLPAVVEALRPEVEPSLWVREMRLAKALRIRIPERLYLASGGRQAGPAARQARAVPGRGRSLTVAARNGLSGPDRQRARSRAPRRFELPPLPRRVRDEQTILQAQHPPDLAPPAIPRLAEMFFWAPQMPLPPALKAFVMPGYARPPDRVARLDAPPGLDLPSLEPSAARVRPPGLEPILGPQLAFAAPASMPIRTSASPELAAASSGLTADSSAGDPITLLSLSSNPRPLREVLTVLPGNQLAPLFRTQPGREASRLDAPSGKDPAAASLNPPAVQPPLPGASGNAPVVRASPLAAAGTSPPAAEARPEAALAVEATRIVHPASGVFDVVVQSSGLEGFPESAGVLTGKPIYSVYLNVGAPKEWILQYALPAGDAASPEVSGGVVRLGNSSPLTAPYPHLTFRPPIKARTGSSYVMVHGFLDGNGRFEGLKVLGTTTAEEAPQILTVLERWEFRPAMQDGQPVRVEILLAIAPE
jgi:hypothetical protein